MKTKRVLSIAGIAAPIIFFVLVITLGALEPGYSHLSNMMSVLGGVQGIRGFLLNAGIVTTGLLVIVFAAGLQRSSRDGGRSKVGMILLIFGGIGLGLSGVFACNEGCTNVIKEPNTIGTIHMLMAFVAGMCLSISPLFFYGRLRKSATWKRYAALTLGAGIAANIPGIVFWVTMATTRLPGVEGLIQRLGIVFVFIWIEVMAWKMLRPIAEQSGGGEMSKPR